MADKTTGVETVTPMNIPQTAAPTIATDVINTQQPSPSLPQIPSAQSVYSPENIKAMTDNINYEDPYSLYTTFLQSPAIIAAQQAVQETQGDISGVKQGLRTTTTALQNQNEAAYGTTGASINLIGKQVGRARDLASNELAALGETLQGQQSGLQNLTQTAQAYYGIAQQERQQLQSLMEATGGDAGINWDDSYEEALKKAKKWEKEEAKKASKKADKDAMKQQLRALGLSTSGSRNELEKRLIKALGSEKAYEQQMRDLELAIKKKSLAGGGTSNEDKEYTKTLNALWDDVDKWKSEMRSDNAKWSDAWSAISNRYGLNADEVDALLGLDYRDKYDN